MKKDLNALMLGAAVALLGSLALPAADRLLPNMMTLDITNVTDGTSRHVIRKE